MKKWILYDKDDWQVNWSACVKNLRPVKNAVGSELPEWVKQELNRKGIFNEQEMSFPIRPISILGKCSTAKYIDCRNIPDHHIENARQYNRKKLSEYFEYIGQYYWFDFDIVSSDGRLIKLRMVVNVGDADCNDGHWGAVWTRNKGELFADIMSFGDAGTSIHIVSKKHIDLYKPYNTSIPSSSYDISCRELEELVRSAIYICFDCD